MTTVLDLTDEERQELRRQIIEIATLEQNRPQPGETTVRKNLLRRSMTLRRRQGRYTILEVTSEFYVAGPMTLDEVREWMVRSV